MTSILNTLGSSLNIVTHIPILRGLSDKQPQQQQQQLQQRLYETTTNCHRHAAAGKDIEDPFLATRKKKFLKKTQIFLALN